MFDFKNSEKMVRLYGEYRNDIVTGEKIIAENKNDMDNDLQDVRSRFNEKIEALTDEKRLAILDVENKYKEIEQKASEEIKDKRLYIHFVENMVGVLNGRRLNEVHRITNEDYRCAASNKIVFSDNNLYDDECISMRAAVLKRGKTYELKVVGFAKNNNYVPNKRKILIHLKDADKEFSIHRDLFKGSDFEEVVKFYMENIKETTGNLEIEHELNEIIEMEREKNEVNVSIKENENLMDFKDLFSHACRKCDFGIIEHDTIVAGCDICGQKMKRMN